MEDLRGGLVGVTTGPAAWLADRVVIDLDPGPNAGLPGCLEVAQTVRGLLGELRRRHAVA